MKVYYVVNTENDDGCWIEENPEADYPREVYQRPTWSSNLVVENFSFEDLQQAFDKEDGDCDFSKTILLITYDDGRICFNPQRFKSREQRQIAETSLLKEAYYYRNKRDIERIKNLIDVEHPDVLSKDALLRYCKIYNTQIFGSVDYACSNFDYLFSDFGYYYNEQVSEGLIEGETQ